MLGILGLALLVGSIVLPNVSSAQFIVSSTALNTVNGSFMTATYDYISSSLSSGGVFLFGLVMTILTIVVWLAWNKIRHIFG